MGWQDPRVAGTQSRMQKRRGGGVEGAQRHLQEHDLVERSVIGVQAPGGEEI